MHFQVIFQNINKSLLQRVEGFSKVGHKIAFDMGPQRRVFGGDVELTGTESNSTHAERIQLETKVKNYDNTHKRFMAILVLKSGEQRGP